MEEQVRETLTRLLTDQSQALKRLVETAERLIRIDKVTGDMVLTVPRFYVSDRDFLGLLLLSRYFAHRLGLARKETMTKSEITQRSGLDEGSVSSRLIELGYRGMVEHDAEGEFSISYPEAEYFLEEAHQNMLVTRNRQELSEQGIETTSVSPAELHRIALLNRQTILVLTSRRIF